MKKEKKRKNQLVYPGVTGQYSFTVQNKVLSPKECQVVIEDENKFDIPLDVRIKKDGVYVLGNETEWVKSANFDSGIYNINGQQKSEYELEWKNFSEVGFDGTQDAINNGACFHHILYRNQWGHYEVPKWTEDDPIYVLNSLGDSCGDGYCGYIEERSRSEHQSYINGISQKSVCIITRG